MEIIRRPSAKVHPDLERKWLTTYEDYADRHPAEPLDRAAAFADATWEGVAPPTAKSSPDSPVARIASVMLCETKDVPAAVIDAAREWERKAGRAASPGEIRSVLAVAGIDPILMRAQRTIPGSGLPPEVLPVDDPPPASADAPKKRGRPRKDAGLAGAAPPKPKKDAPPVVTGVAKTDAEIERLKRVRKTFDPLREAASAIANVLCGGIEPCYRRQVVEFALILATRNDAEDDLKARIDSDTQ
jgi:hypothetical protein